MKRTLLLLLSLIALWNCSTSMPDWYKNREEFYPNESYIVSEGWGETPEKAIENATINMAQIFNTRISVEKNILERYESMSNMKDFDEYFYEFSEQTAKLISDQNLVNIMFVEPVYDKRSKSYFTLAHIDRAVTAKILMDRIKREQGNAEYYVRMAQSNNAPLVQYHYYTSSWLTAGKIKMMQEQLDVLIPGLDVEQIYTYTELQAWKDKAAKKIDFMITVKGDSNGRLKQAIRTAVNKAGFSVVDNNAILNINSKAMIKKLDIDQKPLSFVSWELQLKMNKQQNETALSLMEEGKEGSTNIDNARLHAYESMQKFIEKDFHKELIRYFDKMTK